MLQIVNAFLMAQKLAKNLGNTHVLMLPSYLATLWLQGNFNH